MTGTKLFTDHAQGQNRPRAASAYGTQTSRRNITTVPQNHVIVNMGAH